jgi:hypothetical protein
MSYTEPTKRKNQSPLRVIVNAWGCLLGLIMLGLGGAVGLLGAIFVAPQLLGFNLTATALAEHEIVLAATAVDLEERARNAEAQATNFAFEVQATQALILNEYELLGQTATQSSSNISATGTALAEANVQRQTAIALDYRATQAQLQENATDAEIDFRNTQAALGIPQASSSNLVRNPYDFSMGLDQSIWQPSDAGDWQASQDGLTALHEDAWLLEQETILLQEGDYSLQVRIQSSREEDSSDYWLFIVGAENSMAIYLRAEGNRMLEAAFYSFDLASLENGALSLENAALISRVAANQILDEDSRIELLHEGGWLRLVVDGQVLMLTDQAPVTNGRFGVQMPLGAVLLSVEKQ